MIILRQKEFTRAEKEAFIKLYRVTGGFKRLPKGSSPRDVLRFNRLAGDLRAISLGDTRGIDLDNAKILLKNIGLEKESNLVEPLFKKYTNKRALIRLKNQKNLVPESMSVTGPKKDQHLFKLQLEGADFHDARFGNFNKLHEEHCSDPLVMNYLDNYANSYGVRVEATPLDYFISKPTDSYITTAYDLSKTISGNDGKLYRGVIAKSPIALDSDIAHEMGHFRTFIGPTGRDMKWARSWSGQLPEKIRRNSPGKVFLSKRNRDLQVAADSLVTVANENSANSYGKAILNRLPLSKNKKKLDNMGFNLSNDSYIGTSLNHAAYNLR